MQVALAKYPQETAQILQRDIIWFFLNDEPFVSKTLNKGHVELSKFPASAVCQLAKKFESSKATTKHIKQVTRDPQAVQVNLLWHQHTEMQLGKKKHKSSKFRQEATKHYEDARKPQVQKKFDPEHTKSDRCNRCCDSLHREGFRCPVTKHQCKICKKIGHFSSLCYKKRDKFDGYKRSLGSPKPHQLKIEMIHTQNSLCTQKQSV